MDKTALKSNLILLLAAMIWGLAFVAQRAGMKYVGPFTYNGIRFALGALSLLPLILLSQEKLLAAGASRRQNGLLERSGLPFRVLRQEENLQALKSGFLAGLILFLASSLQQFGLVGTSAGKSAFVTGLYIVLVPIFGLPLKHQIGKNVWLGAGIAAIGLYFLCVTEVLTISGFDLLTLGSAFFFTVHILLIDNLTKKVHLLKLAFCQFLTCSVISLAIAGLTEQISLTGIGQAAVPILYGGIGSVGIAYTLQIIGQKNAKPASAAIIMSGEAVFGLLGGFLLLGERLGIRGLSGALLMLAGMFLAQLPIRSAAKAAD